MTDKVFVNPFRLLRVQNTSTDPAVLTYRHVPSIAHASAILKSWVYLDGINPAVQESFFEVQQLGQNQQWETIWNSENGAEAALK